jgi:hypothetical protein
MKKFILTALVMLVSITSFAQFTVYEPATVDRSRNSGNSYSGYYYNNRNYNNYNSYNYSVPQQPQSSQTSTVRGYYIRNNQWQSVLLRVRIDGDDVYINGIKRSMGWDNNKYPIYSVQPTMPQTIKENFEYYINAYDYGKIYF